jgi:hypothetical protein
MSAPLGFSVSCYRGDVPLLRGCLASIRTFAPDAPICVFTDGDFPLRRLERAYDLTVIPLSAVRSRALRERSYGYGLTKMVALWEAPFERIIHVDADAVLWGDIRANLPNEPWDFVFNEPHEVITEKIQRQQYFDPELVAPLLEGFQWRNRPYFNSGVFACRVGSFPLEDYLRCLDVLESNYGSFPCMDQGILSMMVFKAMDDGLITARQAHLQTVVPVVAPVELSRRFRFRQGSPQLERKPTVIHWAGPKPYILNAHPFSEPMDVFRAQAMRRCGLPRWVQPQIAMRVDELLCRSLPAIKQKLKTQLKAWLKR